jgi:acetyl-CoA C-acetyltransferase
MADVVIVSSIRTAVGSFGGTLKSTTVVELGSIVLKEALKKVNL